MLTLTAKDATLPVPTSFEDVNKPQDCQRWLTKEIIEKNSKDFSEDDETIKFLKTTANAD